MGTTGSTNALFTGSSQFSSDFQQVIQRAVAFASLPMQQMQNQLGTLQSQQSELGVLNTQFSRVQSAIQAIESAAGAGLFSASVDDNSVASVSLSGTVGVGTISLDVLDPGGYASAMSADQLPAVADPNSGNLTDAASLTLTVGTSTYTITPSTNSLSSLADALNQSGAVDAVVVNIGGPAAPRYVLSVQGAQLGDLPIQLTANDGSNSGQALLDHHVKGSPATYQVNGQPSQPITSNSRVVTISPGVTATLLGPGSTNVTISRSTQVLSQAFSNLATAYNSAMSEVNKNRGQSGGALAGQSILMELSGALHNLTGYTDGSGGASSLSSLGFSFDNQGVLSFDPAAFSSAVQSGTAPVLDFLGSSSSGGFLKAAADAFNGLEDSTNGLIPQALSSIRGQIAVKNQAISDQQDKVSQLQTNLQQRLAAADAAIAAMEQQLISLQGIFQAMHDQALSRG
jgi:flagellar hook-associated protein 2